MPARNILIVDGDQALLKAYTETLVKGECHVITSTDGADAFSKFQNQKFDLVITDIAAPKVSGDKLIENIFSQNANHCPIIISSEKVDNVLLGKFGKNKSIYVMQKNIDEQSMLKKVLSLLDSKTPTLDVEFLNPFIESILASVSGSLGDQMRIRPPYLKTGEEIVGDMSLILGITSFTFRGSISISFFEDDLANLVSVMFEVASPSIEELKDGLAEFSNSVVDIARLKLADANMIFQTTTPSIISGKKHHLQHQSAKPPVVLIFNGNKIKTIRLEISIR